MKDTVLTTLQRVGRALLPPAPGSSRRPPVEDTEPLAAPVDGSRQSAERPAVAATVVRSPLAGEVIPLSQVEDPAFAAAMVGPGVAIRPSNTEVVSPVDGTVILVFPTNHAIGLRTETGVEILIHVGIDTVELKGRGSEVLVARGDTVQAGDPLLRFDPEVIAAPGHPLTTPVIVTNSRRVGEPVVVADGTVQHGDELFVIP